MYMYIYIYIYTYIHIHIYTYIHIYIYTYTCVSHLSAETKKIPVILSKSKRLLVQKKLFGGSYFLYAVRRTVKEKH